MNETTTTLNGYSGTSTTTIGSSGTCGGGFATPLSGNINAIGTVVTPGLSLSGNSTINYSHSNLTPVSNMRPTQAKVAVFTITRDADTKEINSTKFVKELWVEQKNGTSIDLIVAKQLDKDFDPETTIIKVLSTVSF